MSTLKEETDKQLNADRILLKQSVIAFVGNLCADPVLRASIAQNTSNLLEEIYLNFEKDVN